MTARRIAVLLQSLDGGGAQRRTVDLVNGFVAQGRAVDLILVEPGDELRPQVDPAVPITLLSGDPVAALADDLQRARPDALLAGAVAEFDFRYSTKTTSDGERTDDALKGIAGKRLTYRRTDKLAA